ncbi:MAG: hypothetical protein ACO1QB_10785 [Verrucomicrobiales bacterium]
MISWKRTLKTLTSERFVAFKDGIESAAVDLHYLSSGAVAGTVILLEDRGWKEDQVPGLLKSLDQDFLPDVAMENGNFIYTVIMGTVIGNFEGQPDGE